MTGAGTSQTITVMGTCATIQVVGDDGDARNIADREAAIARAFGWFRRIEECCSRFEPGSEVSKLASHVGVPIPVSDIVFEAVQFAIAVAEDTAGAFDPTVGADMERRGFNREHRTRVLVRSGIDTIGTVSYRDVQLDSADRTITLRRPLVLDLGAVAKGLAIDMAARELAPFTNFAIDAGGDLFLAGTRGGGAPWTAGIRHPRRDGELIDVVRVSNRAVCTSGDYERRGDGNASHILDARTGRDASALASVTVVAPTALLADALATAAFVLGPVDGIALLERHGVDGLLVTPSLDRHATRDFPSDYSILQDAEGATDDRPADPARARDAGRGHPSDVRRPH